MLEEAKHLHPRVVDLRRRIHEDPELGLETPATRTKILDDLADLDLGIALHAKTSGIVATLRGGRPGKRLLLRGDMDALPIPEETDLPFRSRHADRMHACGHDAHVAMLAGAARLLCARRDELAGEIVFMFQPGEESYGGAEIMLAEGMPTVDAAFAMHVAPQIPTGMVGTKPGAIMASFDDFEIEVRGRGGHASMPHDCIDPIPIACEIVQALQSFVTRQIPATDPGVLTIAQFHAGTTNNVIADRVALSGTMRALSDKTRASMIEGVPRIAEGIARTHNAEARVEISGGYPVLVNDLDFESFARGVAGELLGEHTIIALPTAIMGTEDFSYVLGRAPGVMLLLGVRPPGMENPAPCHSSQMMLDEEAMVLGTALHASVATRFLAG
ncbi:MAG: amidohydrolase [bacterium]|nr:amidohydrolase [Deltaproteobacteria bacterium]MCP4904219.1 amidohydrolase [bacterium]